MLLAGVPQKHNNPCITGILSVRTIFHKNTATNYIYSVLLGQPT